MVNQQVRDDAPRLPRCLVAVGGHEIKTVLPLDEDAAAIVEVVKTRAAAGH